MRKAGIVVAVAVAGLVAISPIAYAGGAPEKAAGAGGSEVVDTGDDAPQTGLVNLGDVNALNNLNVCPAVTAALGLGNVLGILGLGASDPVANAAPVDCSVQNAAVDDSPGG